MTIRQSALASLLLAASAPALAADPPPIATRVDRVEKELRAVQRKVFPGGAPAFSEPEIAPVAPAAQAGAPASQPLNDLTSRVDGLEREVARLTNQLDQDEHRLAQLSEQAAKDRQEFDGRVKALEGGAPHAPAAGGATPAGDAAATPLRAPPAAKAPRPPRAAAAALPDDTVPAPSTGAAAPTPDGDQAEAAYMAGYRLWADKKYAAAEDALAKVAAQYPKHRRASYARNLLGRAYLDDGQPAEAARSLYANYQKDPRGERAPESLFYLGDALVRLKKNDEACRAYGELAAVYGAKMGDTLRGRLPAARKAANCADDDAEAAPTSAAKGSAKAPARKPK